VRALNKVPALAIESAFPPAKLLLLAELSLLHDFLVEKTGSSLACPDTNLSSARLGGCWKRCSIPLPLLFRVPLA
jgi:hypothetical protein